MHLLDTDIVSNLLKPVPSPTLITKLAATPPEQLFTSSITLGELVYGAYRSQARAATLLERIGRILVPYHPMLPFDASAARRYGEVRAQLERQGTPLAEADLRIAAIALARDLILVTGNIRHFQRVSGLTIENWFEQG